MWHVRATTTLVSAGVRVLPQVEPLGQNVAEFGVDASCECVRMPERAEEC